MEFLKAYNATKGILSKVDSNEEAIEVLSIILNTFGSTDDTAEAVIKNAFQFYDETDGAAVHYIICNTVMGDKQVSLVIGTNKEPVPKDLDTDDGVFAYIYNADVTYDSELGYIFLEKRGNDYFRIG